MKLTELLEALYLNKNDNEYYSLKGPGDTKTMNKTGVTPEEFDFEMPDYDVEEYFDVNKLKDEVNKTLKFTRSAKGIPVRDQVARVTISNHFEYRIFDKPDMEKGEANGYQKRMSLSPGALPRIVQPALKLGLKKLAQEDENVQHTGPVAIIFNNMGKKYVLGAFLRNGSVTLTTFLDEQMLVGDEIVKIYGVNRKLPIGKV